MNRMFCLLAVLVGCLTSLSVLADVSSQYGFGASSMGLMGTSLRAKSDIMNARNLPAEISHYKKAQFSVASVLSFDRFLPIESIVVDSEKYGGTLSQNKNVDPNVPNTQNLQMALVFPLNPEKESALALYLSMPVGKVLSVETQSAFYPAYAFYLSDSQRFTMDMHYAFLAKSQWRYSLGLHLFFVTGSNISSRLPASSGGSPRSSNMDMKVDVKPGYALGFSAKREWERNEFGINLTTERDGSFVFHAQTEVNVFGPSPVPITIDGKSSLFYDPHQLQFSWARKFSLGTFGMAAQRNFWSRYRSSIVMMDISGANSFEQLNIDTQFQDTWIPKVAWSSEKGDWNWGMAYSYVPSPIRSQSEASNLIDTDKQVLGMNLGRTNNTKLFGFLDWEYSWSLAIQWQRLNQKTVYKTQTDSVGYPYYKVGGDVVSLAMQLQAEL